MPPQSAVQTAQSPIGLRSRKLSRTYVNPEGELVRQALNTGFLAWMIALGIWLALDAALGFTQLEVILPVSLLLAALALTGLWDDEDVCQKHKHYRG